MSLINESLDKVKIILDIDEANDSKDGLLKIYIQNAIDYIYDYTKVEEIPKSLNSVIVEMTVYQYQQQGVENMSTEAMGAMYQSFIQEYPGNIRKRLNQHRRALFL